MKLIRNLSWKKALFGVFIGLVILPAVISSTALYLPYLFGVDPLFGGASFGAVLHEGYVITGNDLNALAKLASVLEEVAFLGVLLAAFFGLSALVSPFFRKKGADQAKN